MIELQRNELPGWTVCPCCGGSSAQHAPDCKGVTPEAVALRKAFGQPWPTDQLTDDV